MATISQTNGINIGSNCSGVVIVACSFKDNSNAAITGQGWSNGDGTKARALSCTGVNDTPAVSRGTTTQRPPRPIDGQQYYDTTIGLPIWWNSTSAHWIRADGTPT